MRYTRRFFLFLCSMFMTWGIGARLANAGDGSVAWFTIESEHFIVSYHEPLHDLAKRVVQVAEKSHEEMSESMGHSPREKTYIVVDDTTDGSNGFASVLPRNSIRVFASAPPSKSDLADHDDWMYALVAHEYAHILHLDKISGIPALVNKVMGKTWAPNQVQPRWVIEGLATYQESRHSSGGRLRNRKFATLLRMATLAGDERGLDEMSNGPRFWPHGNTAYLYGSHFLKYVFDRFGHQTLAKMSQENGKSIIPYGLNRSIQRATGETFVSLHKGWKEYRRHLFSLEEEAVERAGRREGRRLTFSGEANLNPRYSSDGEKIIWQHGSGSEEGHYAVMPSHGDFGQRRPYAYVKRGGEFDLLKDGSMILEQTKIYKAEYDSQELFRWDVKTKEMQSLTKRKRLRDPAISPDESQVAFVMNAQGRRRLMVMELRPEAKPVLVWQGEGSYDQAFDPAWSPDGKTLAFSAWRKGGFRDILLVELETGKVQALAKDRAHDVDPVFSPSGDMLYYASDRSGIYNIYAYNLKTRALFAVTNVLGCALTPTISPNGQSMVYQGCVSDGFELYQIRLNPTAWQEAKLYVNDRPDFVDVEDGAYEVSTKRSYQPLETLGPNRYDIQWDAVRKTIALGVSGSDIVGHHRFNLNSSVDLLEGDVDIGGSYHYSRLWAGLRLTGIRSVGAKGGFYIDHRNTAFREEHLGVTTSIALPLLRSPDGSGGLSLDYDFDYLRGLENEYQGPNPNDALPRRPESNIAIAGVAMRFNYSDIAGSVYTIGPQSGQSFGLSMRINHPALGSDVRSLNLDYRYNVFYRLPWGQTPVLSLRVHGGVRITERARRSRFRLGGVPTQNLVQSLLDDVRAGHTGYLRGFPRSSIAGTQFHLINTEYRQELFDIEYGVQTLPFYLRKVHMAGLLDIGNAFDGELDLRDFKSSLGISLRLEMIIGYFIPGTFDIGYSRGLGEEGIHQWWTLITGSI